jgi:PAS domain S-box-containing protein
MTAEPATPSVEQELEGTRRLQEVSTRLIGEDGVEAVYDEILDTLVAIAGSDLASLQIVELGASDDPRLRLLGHRGFTSTARQRTQVLPVDAATACAVALRERRRVAVRDALADDGPFHGADRELFREAGIRGIVSTPLLSRSGEVVGVMSVHWREPHVATEVELRMLDILARQAADLVDRDRAAEAMRTSEEEQAFMLALNDTLRSQTEVTAVMSAASRLLGERIRANRVFVGEVVDDVVLVHGDYAATGLPMEARHPLASWGAPVVEAYRNGEILTVADVFAHPSFGGEDAALYEATGSAGAIFVPMPRSDDWGTILVATSPKPRAWSHADQEVVVEVARRTGAALDALRQDEALRESEARFRTLVENITDYAIYRMNASGIITDWTEGAARVKGYAAHEVIGRHVSMFQTPEDIAAGTASRVLQEAARTGRAEHETWKVRAGGERFWVNEITSPLRDATGRLVGFTRISRDLTAQRQAEVDREAQLEQERDRREAAEAFMAVMSHELKTPVTSIYSAASLLRKAPGRPDMTELVDDIEEEADRLLRIVDDLLVLSGVDRGLILLAPEPIEIHHELADVVAMVGRRFPDVVFGTDRRGGTMPIVLADPTAFRQVTNNLLTNAAKYAGRDGPVLVEMTEAGGSVIVSVLDRGPGLGPDPAALFTLFHRAPHTARLASGTGIGLYVARQLVEAMGGSIGAEPRDGGGSRFWFALPVAPVDENA